MDVLSKLTEISLDDRVQLASSLKDVLHKKLILGQSRYVCRYGTLSDGHEKITDAQRYFQSIKEMWALANSIQGNKVQAMLAQADLMDAGEALEKAIKDSDKLRAEARQLEAQYRITQILVSIEDQMRMLDEYNKVRLELESAVEAKYPEGLEQAEFDNWKAVAEYRMIKQSVPGMAPERLDNVPMPPVIKAKLGAHYDRMDAVAPLMVLEQDVLKAMPADTQTNLVDFIQKVEEKEQPSLMELN